LSEFKHFSGRLLLVAALFSISSSPAGRSAASSRFFAGKTSEENGRASMHLLSFAADGTRSGLIPAD
jgi:hypothetical protein